LSSRLKDDGDLAVEVPMPAVRCRRHVVLPLPDLIEEILAQPVTLAQPRGEVGVLLMLAEDDGAGHDLRLPPPAIMS
jgi:hypothetical protein